MSKLNVEFLQTGGVPLTNDLMAVLQEAYSTYEVLGDIAGDKTILQGCEVNGANINPGIVVINGEVLPFEGGLLTSTVYIQLEQFTEIFQDQTNKILVRKKTVKFGNSSTVFNWSDFKRLDTLKKMQEDIAGKANQTDLNTIIQRLEVVELKTAPIINGGIVWIWKRPASEIPIGWKECTDIRGKTVFGRDPNDPDFSQLGTNVGSKTKTILKNNLPDLTTSITIIHPYEGNLGNGGFDGGGNTWRNKTISFNPGGTSAPMNVLNPGEIVNFIEPNFQ